MRILVFGRDGQLGKAFAKQFNKYPEVFFIGRSDCNLSFVSQIQQCLKFYQPQLLINASAYTNVDGAESDHELAYAINEFAVEVMARYCKSNMTQFVHFSTDYVFDGDKNDSYIETDICRPLNVYGKSKLNGELAIQKILDTPTFTTKSQFLIIRTSWMYGDGENFIRNIIHLSRNNTELKVISDQFGVPTNSDWLANITKQLINKQLVPSGIYHAVPSGRTTWYEIALHVVTCAEKSGLNLRLATKNILPILSREYHLSARRPLNSCLATAKIQSMLVTPNVFFDMGWKDQVEIYIKELVCQNLL